MNWVCKKHSAKTAWHLSPGQHTEGAGIMKHITGLRKLKGLKGFKELLSQVRHSRKNWMAIKAFPVS